LAQVGCDTDIQFSHIGISNDINPTFLHMGIIS
jgi:hypothetical protein